MFGTIKRLLGREDAPPPTELSAADLDRVKFQARIAIVDDEELPHTKRLRDDGYNISDFHDIEHIDDFLRKKFDVVVLDIQGVGGKLSEKSEGWGILKYLKNTAPHIVVVVFTGAEWSITKYKEQADLADEFIGKDAEFLDFKMKLDAAIRKAFSPSYHIELELKRIKAGLVNAKDVTAIESIVRTYSFQRNKAMSEARKVTDKSDVLQGVDYLFSILEHIKNLGQ